MSRHKSRQDLALEYGATDIRLTERGEDGIRRIRELTDGIGADSVLECVGTQESMQQAISVCRPGGHIGYVGVPHGVTFDEASASSLQIEPAQRPGAGAPLPAASHGSGADPPDQSRQGLRSRTADRRRRRRPTRPWTSAAPSRRCFGSVNGRAVSSPDRGRR